MRQQCGYVELYSGCLMPHDSRSDRGKRGDERVRGTLSGGCSSESEGMSGSERHLTTLGGGCLSESEGMSVAGRHPAIKIAG